MRQFEIGDKVKTTPQWERMRYEPRNGVVIGLRDKNVVVFEPPEGGKEMMSADWLMFDNQQKR